MEEQHSFFFIIMYHSSETAHRMLPYVSISVVVVFRNQCDNVHLISAATSFFIASAWRKIATAFCLDSLPFVE